MARHNRAFGFSAYSSVQFGRKVPDWKLVIPIGFAQNCIYHWFHWWHWSINASRLDLL